MPVDSLSAILTGVRYHAAKPEHDDGNNPKNVDGETDEASQEGDQRMITITTSDTRRWPSNE